MGVAVGARPCIVPCSADLNQDGKIDVVVTRLNESPLVLTNLTETGNHWL